jgi:hypothetical protein
MHLIHPQHPEPPPAVSAASSGSVRQGISFRALRGSVCQRCVQCGHPAPRHFRQLLLCALGASPKRRPGSDFLPGPAAPCGAPMAKGKKQHRMLPLRGLDPSRSGPRLCTLHRVAAKRICPGARQRWKEPKWPARRGAAADAGGLSPGGTSRISAVDFSPTPKKARHPPRTGTGGVNSRSALRSPFSGQTERSTPSRGHAAPCAKDRDPGRGSVRRCFLAASRGAPAGRRGRPKNPSLVAQGDAPKTRLGHDHAGLAGCATVSDSP